MLLLYLLCTAFCFVFSYSICLGGLCRTAEILGAGRLTVASLSVLQERDFTGVSVTAESWLPIEEVPEER
jgi:hypothetical protein